ncbi:MAG: hypothetical protein Q8936_23165 [Bacillota bacterium]|nr:hypothetical protein [Bacillota bacterium]
MTLEDFINDVKQKRDSISYKTVETIGKEGTVELIRIHDGKIYRKVEHFDKDFIEIVEYDIKDDKYQRRRLYNEKFFIGIILDGERIYTYNNKMKCIIESSGEDLNKKRELKLSQRFYHTEVG